MGGDAVGCGYKDDTIRQLLGNQFHELMCEITHSVSMWESIV